jgi:hypothetical protein
MKITLLMAGVLTGLALSASAGLLEGWDFDDGAGTALNGVANSGSLNSVWNFGGANMATDGGGNFVLPGDGGNTTRKLPKKGTANALPTVDAYAAPLAGSDTYTLEMTLSAWDLTGATTGDRVNFKALDSGGVLVALLQLEKDSDTTARLRFASGNASYRNYAVGLTGSSTTISIDFNMAAATAEYFVNGASEWTFSGQTYAGNIGGLIFTKAGTWSTAASSVSIDSMGLSVIPEPATMGLFSAAGLLMWYTRRKFTS